MIPRYSIFSFLHLHFIVANHLSFPIQRRDLVIHETDKEYCRIRVDPRGYVYSFTYLGPRDIPTQNLACLYGRHEKYFNRLVSRFDEKVIPDFISYVYLFSLLYSLSTNSLMSLFRFFQETWALVMFHDRFPTFVSNLLEESIQKDDIKDIVDDLANQTKEVLLIVFIYKSPNFNPFYPLFIQVDEMYEKFDKTLARDEMNQSVFDYLMTTNVFQSYP